MLRASLAAARMSHTHITTPHLLLGLLSTAAAASPGSSPSAAAAAKQYAAAEAAVRAVIEGLGIPAPAAGAAPAVGGSRKQFAPQQAVTNDVTNDVVSWCGEVSNRVRDMIRAAEQHRQEQGKLSHCMPWWLNTVNPDLLPDSNVIHRVLRIHNPRLI